MALITALSACVSPSAPPTPSRLELAQVIHKSQPKAVPGQCWAKETTPAVFESVTQQSKTGKDSYASYAQQRLVQPPHTIWFETPCPEALRPELIASLQRALMARGVYMGEINGQMSPATQAAVRAYQSSMGLASAQLSTAVAKDLGLIAGR